MYQKLTQQLLDKLRISREAFQKKIESIDQTILGLESLLLEDDSEGIGEPAPKKVVAKRAPRGSYSKSKIMFGKVIKEHLGSTGATTRRNIFTFLEATYGAGKIYRSKKKITAALLNGVRNGIFTIKADPNGNKGLDVFTKA